MPHPSSTMTTFAASHIRSLSWDGDELVDWAGGNRRFTLAGHETSSQINYTYTFDAAIAEGDDAVVYTNYGTKALVLRNGNILREINRSYYCANAYDYPVTLFSMNDRLVIAHCPDSYNRLEIEDFKTGKRLTGKTKRKPDDFFHSRLCLSPNGKYLMSAGWVWQPVDVIKVYDLERALNDPTHLDGNGLLPIIWAEEASAAFSLTGDLVVGLNDVESEDGLSNDGSELRVYAMNSRTLIAKVMANFKFGRIASVGNDYVLNFYEYPHLIERKTGAIVQTWPDIACGSSTSSIRVDRSENTTMHIAVDLAGQKYAIAYDEKISIIAFT